MMTPERAHRGGRQRRRRARSMASACAVVLVASCASRAPTARALRREQLGSRDWLAEHIGDVQHAYLDARHARLFTQSAECVASVDASTGAIAWRAVHDASEGGVTRVAIDDDVALATSGDGGKHIRAYDTRDGELLWEGVSYSDAMPSAEARAEREVQIGEDAFVARRDVDGCGDVDVVTLAKGEVVMRSLRTGEVNWRANVRDVAEKAIWERVFVHGEVTYAVGRELETGAPCACAMTTIDGTVIGGQCASARQGTFAPDQAYALSVGTNARVIGVTPTGRVISVDVAALVKGKGVSTLAMPSELAFTSGERVAYTPVVGSHARGALAAIRHGVGVLASGEACALTRVNVDTGALEIVKTYADACPTFSAVSVDGEDVFVGVVRARTMAQRGVMAYAMSSVSILDASEIALGETRRGDEFLRNAPLARAFISKSKDSILTVDADATMSLHRGKDVVWTREEASSQARDVIFGHLPDAGAAAHVGSSVRLTSSERIEYQVLSIKMRFRRATSNDMNRLVALRQKDSTKNEAHKDHNGFRRSIIALSARGGVIAMHNGDGRALWRQYLGASGLEFSALMEWKPLGGEDGAKYALAIAKGVSTTSLVVIDQFTGEIVGERVKFPFRTAHVLPFDVAGGAMGLVLVDSSGAAAVYPKADTAWLSAREQLRHMSYYKVDQELNEVRGYKFNPAPEVFGSEISALHSWTVAFPPESGDIVGFASKPMEGEVVNSWVRVPGDRSTMFKYLNPNTIFVATSTEAAVHVNLIDAVTGRILYRVRHGDARGPVHAVMCENWVAYHYFNTRAQRYAMSVLEMYDDSEDRRGLAVGDLVYKSIFGGAQNETSSSLAPPTLRIIGQSYYIRPEAKMLSVTRSMRGVTEPAVLLATATDQVTSIDKRFLDPRRPNKPTPADREEGLIPYNEVIPVFPASWATYHYTVRGLRGIITAPATLESSVLFFAYGLDAFYTRLNPSQSFDALDDDFSHALLVFTLIALVIGTIVAKRAADDADAARAWR